MINLSELLEPIASQFRSLGIPEPITHWGHPVMMGIVVVAMGSFVGFTGWQGRLAADKDVSLKNRSEHRKLAPWMFLFIALGYTGGLLSLVMQHEPVMESPHFWTGSTIIVLLAANSLISLTGFGGDKQVLRAVHAYVGSTALLLMVVHAALGLKLGLSI
jgi:fucose 4-O-acetylase-like acetyltransferase